MSKPDNDFESASKEEQRGLVAEFMAYVKATSKYWLIPLILLMLLLAGLLILSKTAAAPFIYTLF